MKNRHRRLTNRGQRNLLPAKEIRRRREEEEKKKRREKKKGMKTTKKTVWLWIRFSWRSNERKGVWGETSNEKDVGCELNHDVCFEKVIKSSQRHKEFMVWKKRVRRKDKWRKKKWDLFPLSFSLSFSVLMKNKRREKFSWEDKLKERGTHSRERNHGNG